MYDLPILKYFPYELLEFKILICKSLLLDNEDVFDVLKVYNQYKVSPDMTFTFSKKKLCKSWTDSW